MGKKSRKTKAKASDFQKTKLKVGKKRPLPSNVTEVAFKSQAIYVAEQMKNVDVGFEVIQGKETKAKRNIPELLSQVGHFNKNFRADSLTSLRHSFVNDKDLMRAHLPKVFLKVPHSIRDDDQQVRKSSIAFFQFVLGAISSQEMAPFFDGFLLHLYCAMTHIYDDVKKDSLQIFDLCVKNFPGLLTASSSDKLLQHFIDLISTKQTKSGAKDGKTDVTRVLSMKLSNKESSIVWRNRILERLCDLLYAYGESGCRKGVADDDWQLYMKEKYNNRPFDWRSSESGVILNKFQSMTYFRKGFATSSLFDMNTSKVQRLSPWELITTLVPLLIDTWHEATSDESKQFSEDSVVAMTNVLKITNILLRRFIDSHDDKIQAIIQIRDRYLQDLDKYFFDSFPINYAHARSQPNPKQRKTTKGDVQNLSSSVHSINLSICEIITTVFPNELIGEDAVLLASVAEYLSTVLVVGGDNSKLGLDETGLKQSITVTKALLDAAMDQETVDSLLQPLLVLFFYLDTGSVEKTELLRFFASLYSDFQFPRTRVMDEWVCSLPIILAEIIHGKGKVRNVKSTTGTLCSDKRILDVSLLVISTMRLALVKDNMEFVSEFHEKRDVLFEILQENGPVLFCLPSNTMEDSQRLSKCHHCTNLLNRVFELFLHPLCDVTTEELKLLIQICQMECIPAESVNHAAINFYLRYEIYGRKLPDFTASIQFLSSLLTGIMRCDLQSLQSSHGKNQDYKIVNLSSESQFSRHSHIVDKTCSTLRTVDHIEFIMQRFFKEKILHKYKVLPARSAFAIIKTSVQLKLLREDETSHHDFPELSEDNTVGEFNSDVGKLVSAILTHCHGNADLSSSAIDESLSEVCVEALKQSSELLRACIMALGDIGYQGRCKGVCRVFGFMMSRSELRENLNLCKSCLNEVLDCMKVCHQTEDLTAMIESTIFSVFATLSSAS